MNLFNINNFIYFIYFIIGGLLFTFIYHFSKTNNTIVCSIIPAFPSLFLVGYLFLYYFNGNLEQYTYNTIFTFGIDVIAMILLLFLLITLKNDLISIFIFILFTIYSMYYLVQNKTLL